MITFTRAAQVEPGAPITSQERNLLARAVNDRLLSGLGDGPWRIVFYVLSAFRQIRNPDASFNLWPPQAEFFERFQAHRPTDGEWPVAGPGEPEGANVASVLPAFVFGNAGIDLGPEDERTADQCPLWLTRTGEPRTPQEFWEIGKRQRGAWDPLSGAVGSPSFSAAQEHYRIRHGRRSPHGNSYGGFAPVPEYLGDCADGTSETRATPSFKFFFTNLRDGTVRDYPGSCPDTPGDVAFIASSPFAYYVYLVGGQVDVLPFADWIEGPYDGGDYLTKQPGNHVARVLNHFASGFRGTEEQRRAWMRHAFDTQAFMTRQYLLAPSRGVLVEDGSLAAEYPRASRRTTAGTTLPAGANVAWDNGEPTHAVAEGCVLAMWYAAATNLVSPTTVRLLNGSVVVDDVELVPDENGNAAAIRVLPTASSYDQLVVRAGELVSLGPGGELVAELAEMYPYKPGLHDLYLVLRLGSCLTNLSVGTDGDPARETMSAEISQAYFRHGCLVNVRGYSGPPGSGDSINTNGVFEAARDWSKVMRIVPRQNLIGYAVEDGKSVLWFRRAPMAWPGSGDTDIFDGIGPNMAPVENGQIKAGYRYEVRTGDVVYAGSGYTAGTVFMGLEGHGGWEGGGAVYEADGIRLAAPPGGETNRWVIGAQFKAYGLSESSLFKPEAYSDYFALSDRCHFYHDSYPDELQNHLDYGQVLSLAPEAPPGYRNVHGKNVLLCSEGDTACEEARVNRYRSCRIYEPDLAIESAVRDLFAGGEALKVTLAGRLHHCPTAPSTISSDIGSWSDAVASEPFRSTENALREYLLHVRTGSHCAKAGSQPGNAAVGSDVVGLPDDPFGTCYPHLYFVKLVPEVPEDSNARQDPGDAPFFHDAAKQVELYLRCMAEGYVDGSANRTRACELGTLYAWDYTYENACYDAFGGRWVSTLPSQVATSFGPDDVRTDRPEGFGPLPNTDASAEVFNQLASLVNVLVRVRVMLPWTIQCKTDYGLAVKVVGVDWPPSHACTGGTQSVWVETTPSEAGVTVAGTWADCAGTFISNCYAGLDGTCDGFGGWNLLTERNTLSWRLVLLDDALELVPETWQDMVQDMGVYGRLLASVTTTTQHRRVDTDPVGEDDGCWTVGLFSCWWDDDGDCYVFPKSQTEETVCDFIPASGTIAAPFVGRNAFAFGRAGAQECYAGVSNTVEFTPALGDSVILEVPLV